jgi:class 3 adenylate cyclase
MERPPVKYARSDDGVNIAYQVFGDGPLDVLFVGSWFGQIDLRWEWPGYRRWLERLSSFARVMVFDKRGVGASDPAPPHSQTLESWLDDARAVMDAASSAQAAVVVWTDAAPMGLMFAAAAPDRVSVVASVNSSPDIFRSRGNRFVGWGTEALVDRIVERLAPSDAANPAFRDWMARFQRASASPSEVEAMYAMLDQLDLDSILSAVRTPVLVVRRRDLPADGAFARGKAELIPDFTYVEVAGQDVLVWAGDVDPLIDEVETFLTGARPAPTVDRALLTVVFSDMVGSTTKAAELGDARWRVLLDAHNRDVRRLIAEHRGREIITKGDEFVLTFDGPARAVRCAQAIHAAAATNSLEMRSGVHTGEVELLGDDIAGIAVHIGARVRELAEPGEILTSRTVRDLVAGSGLEFTDRGTHALKGVPDEWQVFSVV